MPSGPTSTSRAASISPVETPFRDNQGNATFFLIYTELTPVSINSVVQCYMSLNEASVSNAI